MNRVKEKLNHHFILIEDASGALVAPEIISWGEAVWWPKKSFMMFTRLTPGEIQPGTKYRQKVTLPLGPAWDVEITRLIPGKEIERTFLNGIFKGKETVSLEERYNGTKVDYLMRYEVVGIFNKILWQLIFQKMHDRNIERILKALEEYVANQQKKDTR